MNLFERFEVLEDPRDIRGKKYKLIDILIMTIYGLLFGLKDFVNIADYIKLNEEYFKDSRKLSIFGFCLLPFPHTFPILFLPPLIANHRLFLHYTNHWLLSSQKNQWKETSFSLIFTLQNNFWHMSYIIIPLQWSISCWMICAVQPEYFPCRFLKFWSR